MCQILASMNIDYRYGNTEYGSIYYRTTIIYDFTLLLSSPFPHAVFGHVPGSAVPSSAVPVPGFAVPIFAPARAKMGTANQEREGKDTP